MEIYTERVNVPDEFEELEYIKKLCYINVGNFAMHNNKLFKKYNMKIAYGFCNNPTLGEKLWFRHCFVLYKDRIIDVTLPFDNINRRYIVFKTFNSFNELVETDVFLKDTSMIKYLLEDERKLVEPLLDNNFKELINNYKHSQDTIMLNI